MAKSEELTVHGDIRHLERQNAQDLWCYQVHGDIRHLEKHRVLLVMY